MFDGIIVAYEDANFKVRIQPIERDVHLHVDVTNWKPSVLKRMYEVFVWIEGFLKDAGFRRMMTISPNPKFAKLFGGEVVMEFKRDGVYYEVIEWELK